MYDEMINDVINDNGHAFMLITGDSFGIRCSLGTELREWMDEWMSEIELSCSLGTELREWMDEWMSEIELSCSLGTELYRGQ